ncbi:Vsp/OspC family lipoprotein [Borrelia parkeri]|uniref:Vsp/OspC family lipoprotein n=1 Tax=Borrelia parkeri TaxID=141 RepID=UPI001FF2EB45|nr:Vsp/OspC family lipoprotein [Borrelia parkeri]
MKRITFCALLMTLFLLMSCNNSGKNLKDDEVAKPDGTVIDLAKVSAEIKEATVFVAGLREVQVLVFSINDLAKVIGKKIDANGSLVDDSNHHGPLVSGAYQIITSVNTKLKALELEAEKFDGMKSKIIAAKTLGEGFLTKLKTAHSDIAKNDAQDTDVKKALVKDNDDKTKGAEELGKLNTAVNDLVKSAKELAENAIKKLTASVKKTPTQSS